MTDWRGLRTPRGAIVLAVLAAALAVFAACRAREETGDRFSARAALPPIAEAPFWIGVWVGPPALDRDPVTWRRLVNAGIDVSMGPLEDRYHRVDNLARLAFLDTTRSLSGPVMRTFVRDDSLHPDETRRAGWRERVAAIVRAYGGARSLGGYFLADEPRPDDVATWAPLARELRRLDPAHPAFVNFAGVPPGDASNRAARARWRQAVERAVREGELASFTVDAYPFGVDGRERPHFLATLQDAAAVSRDTGRPFGVVLQWTGHGDLKAATTGEARYQAMQALVHGASCVIWFTYWTPNPNEDPWYWHDGAVAYDGTPTARLDTLAEINGSVHFTAGMRGSFGFSRYETMHFGGELPVGFLDELPRKLPRVAAVDGGPCTIGLDAASAESTGVLYLIANRDWDKVRTFTVQFDSTVTQIGSTSELESTSGRTATGLWWTGALKPGGAAVISARTRRPLSSAHPRTPSPPGTR